MSTIFYSMAGEGRGHATRVRALIEDLRENHKIILYAPDDAFELLQPVYNDTDVSIKKIPGLKFYYNQNKKLNYYRSAVTAIEYFKNLPTLVKNLQKDIDKEKPDIIISDFDPALPRAAKKCGLPFISFDHQHFLKTYDLSALPLRLRAKAAFMASTLNGFYNGQEDTIVSSFYFPPLKKKYRHVKQIGVLLNREILKAKPEKGKHILVYLRKFGSNGILESLIDCKHPVKVYGLGKQSSRYNVKFHDIDLYRFIEDLASSKALITTAGNQVVGEALYLGKPVLAMPETGNFEQEINGYFLKDSGGGNITNMQNINAHIINEFMSMNDYYRTQIDSKRVCGNKDAIRIINNILKGYNKDQAQVKIPVRTSKVRAAS